MSQVVVVESLSLYAPEIYAPEIHPPEWRPPRTCRGALILDAQEWHQETWEQIALVVL